jgi:hypothetical protein
LCQGSPFEPSACDSSLLAEDTVNIATLRGSLLDNVDYHMLLCCVPMQDWPMPLDSGANLIDPVGGLAVGMVAPLSTFGFYAWVI